MEELRRLLPRLWDAGWQPAEVVRQGRRASVRAGRLVAAAVLADHATRAPSTLDPRWAAQVEALAGGGPGWADGLDPHDAAAVAAEALAICAALGPIAVLLPPPGSSGARPAAAPGGIDGGVLAKVRALLAQAESTTFEAEAETFTAKAQDLMARHAIDQAVLWDRRGRGEEPVTLRLPVDDPYARATSLLLQVVAERSRCRAVHLGRYALSSVVGFAPDVEATELLFTSLRVQSQVALRAEATRSRRFRSSFLLAYAGRIGERLAAVNEQVEAGGAALPVLAARAGAVDDAVDAAFGRLGTLRVRGGTDPVGWARGGLAADRAELTSGRLDR